MDREDSFLYLMVPLTCGVHHRVGGLPPQQEPEILGPQLRTAAPSTEPFELNISNLPQDLGVVILEMEVKTALTEGLASHSQQSLTIRLGLLSRSGLEVIS